MVAKHSARTKTSAKVKPSPQKSGNRQINIVLSVMIALAVGISGYVLIRTQASGFFASTEPESGTVSGNATVVNDSSAYGGKAIQFNEPAATPPPSNPGTCTGYPDATCTGVPQGVTLTKVNGDVNVTTAGTIIDSQDISGIVTINANNVTIKRSIVRGRTGIGSNGAFINIKGGSNILVEDVEITSDHPSVYLDGIWADNATINRVNIHGGVDGMKVGSNTKVTNSYIHDMNFFNSDPNQGGGSTHNDGIQILDGANILISGNRLLTTLSGGNAAIQVTQDFGPVTGLQVANNYMDYGGCTLNIAHKVGSSLTVSVSGNHFGHHSSFTNCPILLSTQTTMNGTGNVWDDNGQAVPIQRHD